MIGSFVRIVKIVNFPWIGVGMRIKEIFQHPKRLHPHVELSNKSKLYLSFPLCVNMPSIWTFANSLIGNKLSWTVKITSFLWIGISTGIVETSLEMIFNRFILFVLFLK